MFARSSVNMATPCELSLSEIRRYLIDNGGSARNRDLVKYFKGFLTDPETRVDARNKFKEYVNELATIKNDEDEKYLVLKKKYRPSSGEIGIPFHSHHSTIQTSQESQNFPSSPSSPSRDPPPYRSPPPAPSPSTDSSPSSPHFSPPEQLYATVNKPKRMAVSTSVDHLHQQDIHDERNQKTISGVSDTSEIQISSPPVPPRRKSHDKLKLENKENINMRKEKSDNDVIKEHAVSTPDLPSVRERMQRFNRMASETDIHGRTNSVTAPTKKRSDKGADEDDTVSVASQLDGKAREWLVRAAQGDYQALAKLAAEEPRLTRLKDPSSTALHWGAKHGDENIVKLIAGTYKDYIKSVNGTTNGGYTALHLAMQFDHENIFNLLVQVYGANQEIRDHSGKKARQYVASQEAAVSQDTFRKIKARKKHTEKDLGFLRIGSLNVRVKRTTEAFSQFLGVASSTSHNHEKIHKTWGSADNIQEHKMMLPPRYAPIKKRRSKRAQDFISSRGHVASQPSTPLPQTKDLVHKSTKPNIRRPSSITAITPITSVISHDSDSDGACGFDSAWRGSAQL